MNHTQVVEVGSLFVLAARGVMVHKPINPNPRAGCAGDATSDKRTPL